jgi:hypothetical protein
LLDETRGSALVGFRCPSVTNRRSDWEARRNLVDEAEDGRGHAGQIIQRWGATTPAAGRRLGTAMRRRHFPLAIGEGAMRPLLGACADRGAVAHQRRNAPVAAFGRSPRCRREGVRIWIQQHWADEEKIEFAVVGSLRFHPKCGHHPR